MKYKGRSTQDLHLGVTVKVLRKLPIVEAQEGLVYDTQSDERGYAVAIPTRGEPLILMAPRPPSKVIIYPSFIALALFA